MNIFAKIKRLFIKEKPELAYCACKQSVPKNMYIKKEKHHRIGSYHNKSGRFIELFCDGVEK